MKKLFTLILAGLMSFALFAQAPLPNRVVKEVKVENNVELLYTEEEDGVEYVFWTGEAPAYYVALATPDYSIIAEGAWYSSAFDLDGYFGFSTSLLLEYGYVSDSSYFNDDYTLKPGNYLMYIEGIDEDFNTVENPVSFGFTVEGVITGLESVSTTQSNKFIKDGRVYIQLDSIVYDILGNRR